MKAFLFALLFFSAFAMADIKFQDQGFNIAGRNASIGTGVQDIWSYTGAVTYPTIAAATFVISSSANDKTAGTGAITVAIEGLDSNYLLLQEMLTINGTTSVVASNQYLRVNKAYVVSAGSGGTNAGTVDVYHASIILSRIPTSRGQSEQAIFTTPANFSNYRLLGFSAGIDTITTPSGTSFSLDVAPYNKPFRTIAEVGVVNLGAGFVHRNFAVPVPVGPKSDVRLRALASGTTGAGGYGHFEIDFK